MTEDLIALLNRSRLKRLAKLPAKRQLYRIFLEIERKKHYFHYRCWEILIEMLGTYLGLTETKDMKLYKHIEGLLETYYIVAQNDPWDHLGQIYVEQSMAPKNSGVVLTPKNIVDLMCSMTMMAGQHKYDLRFDPVRPWRFYAPPQSVLDPCVGSGRFLLAATRLNPEVPLELYGIEIRPVLYRACLVNMRMFANHPYHILCADSLALDKAFGYTNSPLWKVYGNKWDPPNLYGYYVELQPKKPFSLRDYVKEREEDSTFFWGVSNEDSTSVTTLATKTVL